MTPVPVARYFEPSDEAARAYFSQPPSGPIVMLNLLRFRAWADYSANPELAPLATVTGEAAYRKYMEHTLPHLERSGGAVLFYGRGGQFLIGPSAERWDAVMLVRQTSVSSFLAFATNTAYAAGLGHRVAALEDSRLLPLVETPRDTQA